MITQENIPYTADEIKAMVKTIEELRKKYNGALERAKKLQETCDSQAVVEWCEYIFPELKESEDEQIRKWCISHFKSCINVIKDNDEYKEYLSNKVIHWLEKQGKQKTYGQRKECEDCQFNYVGECKGSCQMKRDEQNPTDKVEPKFKVGDWVVYDHRPYQVVELPKEGYINLGLRRNGKVEFAPSPYCRHWSIQDAKDGDVLSGEIDGDKYIFSFKKLNGRWIETQGVCYCETTGECIEDARFCNHYQDFFKPASKEECDVLLLKTVNHQLK